MATDLLGNPIPPKTTATTTNTTAPNLTAAQLDYYQKNYGGIDNYAATQNQRYAGAVQSGDTALINKLAADAGRVGFSLNAPAAQPNNQGIAAQSSQSYIDALNEARKQQTLAQLGKSRDAALSNLGAEKSAIQPKYYDARNQTAAGSQQQARNFAEFMAARGGSSSGAGAQAELTRGMALQGNLGSLNRQEAQAYTDIERRTSDLQNAYQSDVAAANAGIEADRMQAMLNDYYQQQNRDLQIAELMGIYNGQQTLAGKSFDWSKIVDTAGLTGSFNGQQTLAGKSLDQNILDSNRNYELNSQNQSFNQNLATKQFERSQFESDRDYNFAVGQQEWENNFKSDQFDWQKAQQSWENAFQEKNFEQSMKDAAASRGLQWASLGQREKERVADEAFRQKQFNYQVQQDTIANEQKASNISPYIDELNSMYVTRNPSTGAIAVNNQTALRNAIIARNLSDAQTDQLLLYYGLPTG